MVLIDAFHHIQTSYSFFKNSSKADDLQLKSPVFYQRRKSKELTFHSRILHRSPLSTTYPCGKREKGLGWKTITRLHAKEAENNARENQWNKKTEKANIKQRTLGHGYVHIFTGLCNYSHSILSRLSSSDTMHKGMYAMAQALLRPQLVENCTYSAETRSEGGSWYGHKVDSSQDKSYFKH